MAYADPQVITINGVENSLPRTSSGVNTGAFTSAKGDVKLSVSHSYGKRNRRMLRLDFNKIAPDAFTSLNLRHSMSTYIVVDGPTDGFTPDELEQVADAFVGYLASTSALPKLIGGEN
jgi:hypothetical protein